MSELKICITFDTDSDPSVYNHKNSISFENLDYSLNKISNKFIQLENLIGAELPINWFVRSDNQIKSLYGDYDWTLKKYSKFWTEQLYKKNEIHWHAHIYEFKDKKWNFPTKNDFFYSNLEDIYKYLSNFHSVPKCIRLGEAYMNDEIMSFIKELGLQADSSAIPGRIRNDKEKFFDWSKTNNHPYFPSTLDYQINELSSGDFLEIPMNTIYTKCKYDKNPILRYVNLSFNTEVILDGLENFIKNYDYLVTITHPYEFFEKYRTNNGLISYDINNLEKNIKAIIKLCEKNNKKYKFIRISELIDDFIKE